MSVVLTFAMMMVYWILLSGKFDSFHIALGVISSAIVALWSSSLLFEKKISWPLFIKTLPKLIIYLLWLLIEVIKSNIHVIKVVLAPNVSELIEPKMIRFKTKLKSEEAKYLLANSITLTPGTVTVRIEKNEVLVHALTPQTAEGVPGDMERKIAH